MIPVAVAEKLSAGLSEMFKEQADPARAGLLLSYLELLNHWNRSYNLTAIRDPEQMVTRHLLDSLSVMPWIDGGPVLDAGSGAGFPGIPLAIMNPRLHFNLLDSAGKKVRFLRQVKRQLKLQNVHPVQARLESWKSDEPLHLIISRAFTGLCAFARSSRHLMGLETRLLAMKGKHPDSELEELPDWVQVNSIEKLEVPGLQEERHLVMMSLIP
jgi:16S rRNA (guanine527-N7)-methyltransferase